MSNPEGIAPGLQTWRQSYMYPVMLTVQLTCQAQFSGLNVGLVPFETAMGM